MPGRTSDRPNSTLSDPLARAVRKLRQEGVFAFCALARKVHDEIAGAVEADVLTTQALIRMPFALADVGNLNFTATKLSVLLVWMLVSACHGILVGCHPP